MQDRLWLVKDGRVKPYDDDLQDYRRMLLTPDTRKQDKAKAAKPAKPAKPKPSRDQMLAMKAEVRKCEDRVNKINDMADKLSKKLADSCSL